MVVAFRMSSILLIHRLSLHSGAIFPPPDIIGEPIRVHGAQAGIGLAVQEWGCSGGSPSGVILTIIENNLSSLPSFFDPSLPIFRNMPGHLLSGKH